MQNHAVSFIVKTTFDCNMNCRYCYEGHRSKIEKISLNTTDNLINKVGKYAMDTGIHTSFVWHGGEPLIMGKGFYEHVVNKQKSISSSFRPLNSLQTNGLLINDAFACLLARNHFSLGVSLDGPAEIHDAQRLAKNGKSTFSLAINAVTTLRKHGIAPGVVAIFTRNTLNHLHSFYSFFRNLGTNVKLSPLIIQGNATDTQSKKILVSPIEYGSALINLFDKWINEPSQTFIFDPFDNIFRRLISGKYSSCIFAGKCHNYFRVFPNGDIYLCGRNDSPKDILGNINTDSIESILTSSKRQQYAFAKASLKETCGICEHFDICHGGCTSSSLSTTRGQVIARDRYCKSHAALFAHIKAFLKRSVETRPSCRRLTVEAHTVNV